MTKTIKIKKEQADEWNRMLDLDDYDIDSDRDGIIDCITVDFGEGIQADLKLCNGEPPYIDPVLFDNGNEVMFLEAFATTVEGEYSFRDGNK